MRYLICGVAVFLFFGFGDIAAAQVTVLEGGSGKRTILSKSPHAVGNKMMVRAVSTTDTAGNIRWALLLYGTDGEDDVTVTMDRDTVETVRIVTNTEAPGGRTRVFIGQKDFYRLGQTSKAKVRVGDITFTLPEPVRKDVRAIYRKTL